MEAEEILALVSKSERVAALGFDANRGVVLSGTLQDFRIVHFATHSALNSEEPLLSSLVLSQFNRQGNPIQGKLRAAEISNLDLSSTELVVLSTCGPARGIPSWDAAALPASFLDAGAARVLFNTWNISDRAVADMMVNFYAALLGGGYTVPEALRRSQLKLLADPRYDAPYYWAGFTLQGDWT
jgi:CHAT domain-containing protein